MIKRMMAVTVGLLLFGCVSVTKVDNTECLKHNTLQSCGGRVMKDETRVNVEPPSDFSITQTLLLWLGLHPSDFSK